MIQDIRLLCQYKGVKIIEEHMMSEYVHLLVNMSPKLSMTNLMGYFEEKSALMMFNWHANLEYNFGRHFWSVGYYVSTAGLNEATFKVQVK